MRNRHHLKTQQQNTSKEQQRLQLTLQKCYIPQLMYTTSNEGINAVCHPLHQSITNHWLVMHTKTLQKGEFKGVTH